MRFGKLLLFAAFTLSILIAAGVAPAPASAAQGASFVGITVNGCYFEIVIKVQDEGPYFVTVWDDGTQRGAAGGVFPANSVVTFRYTVGDLILQGATGIGIYIESAPIGGVNYASNGSFNPSGDFTACAAAYDSGVSVMNVSDPKAVPGCDILVPIPSTAVVGTFVADAMTYWQPGALTNPVVTLPAGKSAWVFGVDESGEYYKVLWSCSLLWVPVETLGPNYDSLWQGHPLPAGVVN